MALIFERPIPSRDLVLNWGLSGIWSDTSGDEASASVIGGNDGWRGRVDAGLSYSNGDGLTAGVNAFVDGLGERNLETYGLNATLNFQF